MRRTKKPAAPLRAWVPLGVACAMSLLVSETIGVFFAVFLVIGGVLAFASVALGIDLLRKHGTRPLYVTVVVIMLLIGQIRMIQIGLMMLAWWVKGFGH